MNYILIPKVTYLKGANLIRFRGRDKDGSTMWRKMKWIKDKAKAVIKSDKLDREYSTTCTYMIFYG
tara:strand:- start:184 stop:381 length:198 start_codon:yes stop_codon:yes gene_type:complete